MIGNIWFSFIGFLEQILILFATLTGSIGIGIILFTMLTRIVILPLTLKSLKSSRKMQELQPMIKEIQRKHGKDQKKLQEETMKLYQEHRINPVGGCLPMFLQLPIFIGVYQAIMHLMFTDQHQYLGEAMRAVVVDNNVQPLLALPVMGELWQTLGIQSASTITTMLSQPFLGINLGVSPFMDGTFQGVQYLILPVMSVVFQYTQQLMAMPRVQDPQQQAMTRMMMFMPLVFAYIAFIFPAGAVLYWTTSSVIGVVQQYFISGWGSLANYLKFLPPDGKAHKSAQTTPASGHTDTDTDMGETVIEQRPSFWDVLRPLTEMEPATAGAALATTSSASVPPDDVADDTPSHTYDEASAGLASGDASGSEKPKKQRSSSRRRSNRRRQ